LTKIAPHPTLNDYYENDDTRQEAVDSLFDDTAGYYDRVIATMSFGTGSRYRKDALQRAGVTKDTSVLDIGSGTGAVTLIAQELSDQPVIALDPSRGMLDEGVTRGVKSPVQGLGEQLPFATDSFDFLTMGYALRHVPDLSATFKEYHRVLKPGGKLLILEISRPKNRLGYHLLKFYMRHVVPNISALISGKARVRRLMQYYWDTIENCVPPENIVAAIASAGFSNPDRHIVLGMFSEYQGMK